MRKDTEVKSESKPAEVLHEHGFRATRSRVALLELMAKVSEPLSVRDISDKLAAPPDQATLYRTLGDLTEAGVIHRIDFRAGHALFEYTPAEPHHHHAVCTDCGAIEDISTCFPKAIELRMIDTLRNFAQINSHSLEFFGQCNRCATT